MSGKTYHIEIVSIETGEVVSTAGRRVPENRVERHIMAVLGQTNCDKYFVRDVEEPS